VLPGVATNHLIKPLQQSENSLITEQWRSCSSQYLESPAILDDSAPALFISV